MVDTSASIYAMRLGKMIRSGLRARFELQIKIETILSGEKTMNYKNAIKFLILLTFLCSGSVYAFDQLKAQDSDKTYNSTVQATISTDRQGIERLTINYSSDINLCYNSGDASPIELKIIFVMGEGPQAAYYEYPLWIVCPANGTTNAYISFDSKNGLVLDPWRRLGPSDPYIWNRLFPQDNNGHRWYALRVGFVRSHRGTSIITDNKNGEDYRLIFE